MLNSSPPKLPLLPLLQITQRHLDLMLHANHCHPSLYNNNHSPIPMPASLIRIRPSSRTTDLIPLQASIFRVGRLMQFNSLPTLSDLLCTWRIIRKCRYLQGCQRVCPTLGCGPLIPTLCSRAISRTRHLSLANSTTSNPCRLISKVLLDPQDTAHRWACQCHRQCLNTS